MTALVMRGDAAHLPLDDETVDLVVTSPPYWKQRSYTDEGEHYDGQIGSEETPQEYLEALFACTAEWVRVLKPTGSMFIDLGDKYATRYSSARGGGRAGLNGDDGTRRRSGQNHTGSPGKSLLLLPERYRIGCVDRHRLVAREVIVWCLSGGARLYARTSSGDRPVMLRDLVRYHQPADVQLWNGERWTQVLGWNHATDCDGALELELRTGERIGCTAGHRWPTQRGVIRADEIRVGDVIQTGRLPAPDVPATPSALDDEDIGWLVGLYLAEGSRTGGKGGGRSVNSGGEILQFAGHRREEARNARLGRIAQAFHGHANVYPISENGITCNISGAVLSGIVDHYIGRGTALSKRLRMTVWQRSDRFLRALMDGYLEGDGHYDAKNDRWRLGFGQNDELAADLRTLAARLGAKISLRRGVTTCDGHEFPMWKGEWRWTRSAHYNATQDGEVVAIRFSRAREFYDVGVADEPHLFALASGVLTHNSKPNPTPESAQDRCRSTHEDVVHLTKGQRYFAALDEIREPHTGTAHPQTMQGVTRDSNDGLSHRALRRDPATYNALGKAPGDVWSIQSQPLIVPAHLEGHKAAFPMELPRRIILGWSPSGICLECGEGRQPVATSVRTFDGAPREDLPAWADSEAPRRTLNGAGHWRFGTDRRHLGYACACTPYTDHPGTGEHTERRGYSPGLRDDHPQGTYHRDKGPYERVGPWREYHLAGWTPPPTRPAVVVDPFGGTGTTAIVADALGRIGVTVDRSGGYCCTARWRSRDPSERAKAFEVPKPPPVSDMQGSLFGDDLGVL
jgi:hypothetical protein